MKKNNDNQSRTRRSEEERIADLERRIASLRAQAERKKLRRDPAIRHMTAAVRSIDKALAESRDAATRQALEEARSALSACLALAGTSAPGPADRVITPRPRGTGRVDEAALLSYIERNPGKRGEEIAQALGTETKLMRPTMHKLIGARRVKTSGQARATTYFAV